MAKGSSGFDKGGNKEVTAAERLAKTKKEAAAYREQQKKEKPSDPAEPVKKDTARQSEIVNYISKQTGIDLNKYRDDTTRKSDKRDGINVDWSSMSKSDRQKVTDLANRYGGRFTLEDNGAWMKLIRIKKK